MTTASASSLTAVSGVMAPTLRVSPAIGASASVQIMAAATHRSAPAVAGTNAVTYGAIPVASAAMTPGSITNSDCQPYRTAARRPHPSRK
jgi:hypothetical protein